MVREDPLQEPRPHRASRWKAQTLQAHRPTLREDEAELRLLRRPGSRLHLGQIHQMPGLNT